MNVIIPPQVAPTAWTFTQGFLVGQVCFIVLCLLFVRYVVFSPAEQDDGEAWRRRRAERAKVSHSCRHLLTTEIVALDDRGATPADGAPAEQDGIRHVDASCRVGRVGERALRAGAWEM